MAILRSTRGDVSFQVDIRKNTPFKKIDVSKPDIENWIPIDYNCTVFNETYSVLGDINPTLNLFEIRNMLTKLKEVIKTKDEGGTFERVGISTYEFYYELELFDPNEDDEIGITLWLFEATRTNGELNGFERGFRFYVSLEEIKNFTNHFEQELLTVL